MKHKAKPRYTEDMSQIRAYSDIVVQYLLGSPGNQDILLDFLNSVQSFYGAPLLTSVEVINPFNLRKAMNDKLSILDVKAKGSDKRWYNVEVQARSEKWWPERSLYYWAKLYSDQLNDGNHYRKLTPAISISLVNFEIFPELPEAEHCILLKHKDYDKVLTDQLQMYYLELPKIQWDSPDSGTPLERWLKYFKYEGREEFDMAPLFKETPALQKAHTEYQRFTSDDEIRYAYEARQKFIRDQLSFEDTAREEGREKGRAEGRGEGAHEKAIQMVQNCKAKGFEAQLATELSGLPLDEVQRIYGE